jgi:tryptophan-rich sensory protein
MVARHPFLFSLAICVLAVAIFVCYDLIAIALTIALFLLDGMAALAFIPYVAYLIFANIWGYELRRLNQRSPARAHG